MEAQSLAADQELRTLIESYASAIRQEMAVSDEAVREEMLAVLRSLGETLDDRLQIILAEYDERIHDLDEQLAASDSDVKTRLLEQKAVLQDQRERAVAEINSEYTSALTAQNLSETKRDRLEKEWT